jgi:CheY-like chemotaxis protein/HPt (histidine-containing phosphotransfer) domain-containing protein
MTPYEEEYDAELVAERNSYLHELKSTLAEIESLILALSSTESRTDYTGPLTRQIHTIKGTAGSLGLDLLSFAAHRMEDLFVRQQQEQENNETFIDSLLAQNDLLAAIAAAYLAGDEQSLCEVRRRLAETTRSSSAVARDDVRLKRVLIVETSSVTLQFCVKILNEFGAVQVTSVRDGYEALGCLLKERFDAVITSLQVPTIDGQSLLTVLRTIPGPNRATPVVLLTSAAGSLESTKTRPDFVVEKNLGLAAQLRAIVKQLARPDLQPRAAPADLKERVLRKILLIDDSQEIHGLVGLSFKRFPEIEIVGVLDPTRALESVRAETPDLILLDVQMTPVSGKDVMRHIKAALGLSDIPVAFFTGTDDAEEKRELASLGDWQIFKKPFSPKTFSDQVLSLFMEHSPM